MATTNNETEITDFQGPQTPPLDRPVEEEADGQVRTFKNFRHHPDIENFYRFVQENDLRREAKIALEYVYKLITKKTKAKKKSKSKQ